FEEVLIFSVMGCVASTVETSETEISPKNARRGGQTAPNPGRTLLTSSANSPKDAEAELTASPAGLRNSRPGSFMPNEDATSPVSPGKSILRSKSLQGLSSKETGRRATFDAASLQEEEIAYARSVKRRVTFGQAEAREYKVQMTQSRSF
ncbi:ychF, partial [Symbiodinium pilosum]